MPITKPTVGSVNWDVAVDATIDRVNALEGIETTIAAKQAGDSDLTTIAGLTATTDNFIQSKASAWASRTPAQVATDLAGQSAFTGAYQPVDSDLTAIAALAPANDDVVQRKAGAWTNRTLAQLKTDLSLQPLATDLTTIAGLSPSNDDFLQRKAGAWANRTLAQVRTDLAAAPLASPTFTGTVTVPKLVETPVALTDAATIAVDAALGNFYRVTLAGNRTLGAPTNPTDGQKILIEVIQDATGSRTLAYNAIYAFGTDVVSPTLTTTASKRDFIGFIYNSTATKWYCLAVSKGY